jgi:hypothetical protein
MPHPELGIDDSAKNKPHSSIGLSEGESFSADTTVLAVNTCRRQNVAVAVASLIEIIVLLSARSSTKSI